jgi:uncharacterized protein
MKAIIIHGSYGNPNENWYPWLAKELTELAYEVASPQFPTPTGQSLQSWQKIFDNQFRSVQSDMVLIGHSIGAGFILNLLEQSSKPVIATFLVCGFIGNLDLPKFDLVNQSFVCRDFDWQKIRHNMGKAYIFASDNDPYVPLAKSEELADKLQIPVILVPGAGHINAEAGYTKFPLLLEHIQTLLTERSGLKKD